MNIVACIKRVPATDAQAKVADDGAGLDASSFQYMTSFYDEIAVEEAVKTKEQHGGEVTVLTIGSKDATKELRECLAKGGDKGAILVDESWMSRDARATVPPRPRLRPFLPCAYLEWPAMPAPAAPPAAPSLPAAPPLPPFAGSNSSSRSFACFS